MTKMLRKVAFFATIIGLISHSALADGSITVYSAGPKPLSSALAKAFTQNTGVKVQLFQSNSGKVMSRYQAEKK